MNLARLVAVPVPDGHGYAWKWQSADGQHDSGRLFTYFHDCLEDAVRAGYAVDLWEARGVGAPGHQSGGDMK